jgi:IS5 family transposase
MFKQIGLFDEANRLERLSELGDPLEKLTAALNFEIFRPLLNAIFGKVKDDSAGGRQPLCFLLVFKIILLQELYCISDDKTEYLINDRLSFQRFLGLGLGDKVPDAKTIWKYKDELAKSGRAKELFELFGGMMEEIGVITRKGSIIDATFADAPRQRNRRDENKTIKEGGIPEEWQKPENANKLAQKDTDARWVKKGDEVHFGYKDTAKVDAESKLIVDFAVTDAAKHDSQMIVGLIDENDEVVYGDSAFTGEELHAEIKAKHKEACLAHGMTEEEYEENNHEIKLKIHEKGYRNKPLTDEQKANNTEKSRVRARVEHVFGHMENSMGGIVIRTIGITKATMSLTIKNLAYNISRFALLTRQKKFAAIS